MLLRIRALTLAKNQNVDRDAALRRLAQEVTTSVSSNVESTATPAVAP
jgi:hypothetical protein